jgi:periplasmic divalent cation tolerance protein
VKQSQFVLVLVTAPELKTARALTKSILTARLAACVNLVPAIESNYRWKGKIERSREILMLIKTRTDRIGKLEKQIITQHPYDTPEFIVLPITQGNQRYLDWLSDCV